MAGRILLALTGLTALGLAQTCAAASAAPQLAASAVVGPWDERDTHQHFDVRAGANPNQLVVTIPKELQFPGSHSFVLTRTGPATFTVKATDARPGVQLSFTSPTAGRLKMAGAGHTTGAHGGVWMAVNDFTLRRP
ncbi:MAG TPA: hypothetical protein VHV27_04460 [Phenylobacterium sp.]|nr:hypothetical protein [Phenylobacterium sp.]